MNQSATYNISSIEWYAQMACVIQVPITFSGFVSNILLIIAHSKDPLKTLKVSSSLFIINIAFIDVILSFVYLIWSLLTIVSSEYRPILKEGITATVIDTFMEMCYPSFMCLSIERFCSIAFPLWHRVRLTTRVCRYWICTTWLFHLIFETLLRTLLDIQEKLIFKLVYQLVCFLCAQVFYLGTYISLKKQRKNILADENISETTSRMIRKRLENEKRFLVTIAIVCGILVVTVLPQMINVLVFGLIFPTIGKNLTRNRTNGIIFMVISLSLFSINLAVNPFVYLWRLPRYRKTFKNLYCFPG